MYGTADFCWLRHSVSALIDDIAFKERVVTGQMPCQSNVCSPFRAYWRHTWLRLMWQLSYFSWRLISYFLCVFLLEKSHHTHATSREAPKSCKCLVFPWVRVLKQLIMHHNLKSVKTNSSQDDTVQLFSQCYHYLLLACWNSLDSSIDT